MEKTRKEWEEKGRVSCSMKHKTLFSMASRLENMLSLPNIGGLLVEEEKDINGTPFKIFMQVSPTADEAEKIKTIRNLLILASFIPSIKRIVALREDKKVPRNHIDFEDYKDFLYSNKLLWDEHKR